MTGHEAEPQEMLSHWRLSEGQVQPVSGGHINRTWAVRHARGGFILQWVNPIFDAAVHLDIEAVTARLESRGVLTPRLVRTVNGDLWAEDARGGRWRLLTQVVGRTLQAADGPARCAEAGRLLGVFHRALWPWDYQPKHQRLGIHDTERHFESLKEALVRHAQHPRVGAVTPVAGRILAAGEQALVKWDLPARLVHGDPKISNFLFGADGRARCLVDLDTLARLPLPVELGDALRSWCTPQGEDVAAPLEVSFFRAALEGYAEAVGDAPTAAERAAIPGAVETIALELAARFAADALNESYFNWDRGHFASASDHNLARALAQLVLAESVQRQREVLERVVEDAWR